MSEYFNNLKNEEKEEFFYNFMTSKLIMYPYREVKDDDINALHSLLYNNDEKFQAENVENEGEAISKYFFRATHGDDFEEKTPFLFLLLYENLNNFQEYITKTHRDNNYIFTLEDLFAFISEKVHPPCHPEPAIAGEGSAPLGAKKIKGANNE